MKKKKRYDVAVVGSGGSGQMAVLRGVLNHLEVICFSGNPKTSRKSRASWVSQIDYIPGLFDKKMPIPEIKKEVFDFIQSQKALKSFLTLIEKEAAFIDKKDDGFEIFDGSSTYWARTVILATGIRDVQPMIQGSIKPILPFAECGDVYYSIQEEGHRASKQDVAIIGNGSKALDAAFLLKERYQCSSISILTNGELWKDVPKDKLVWFEKYEIKVCENEILEVVGDAESDGLKGFRCGEETIECSKAFVCLGSIVYSELAKQLGAEVDSQEYVVVNQQGETSIPQLYAIGNLVSGRKKEIFACWEMAVEAIEDIDTKTRAIKRQSLGTEQMTLKS